MIRILIVDDEPAYRDSLRLVLEGEGFVAQTACELSGAVRAARELVPDVLIVDWMLDEDVDGLEVAQAIGQVNPNLQTIVISGHCLDDWVAEVGSRPGTQFLEKPFGPDEIIEAVRDAGSAGGRLPG